MIAVTSSAGRDPCGVEAGIRFGDAEAGDQRAVDQGRQPGGLLCLAAVTNDGHRPENVHVDGARRSHAAGRMGDGFHHHDRLGDAEASTTIGFGHGDAEPVTGGNGVPENMRKCPIAIGGEPISLIEGRHQALDGAADRFEVFVQFEQFGQCPPFLRRSCQSEHVSANVTTRGSKGRPSGRAP